MKKIIHLTTVLLISLFTFQSCQKDNDDAVINPTTNLEVQNFIWKGLNQYYLWQTDVPNLADNRFANQTALDAFLVNYTVPQNLFDALRVSSTIDRFSWMVDDYVTLEQSLQGTTKNNGVEFGLSYKPNSTTDIFGYVRYIIPGSDAANKDIRRGELFTAVNGTQLTVSNYQNLLFGTNDNFTLNMADYNGTTVVSNGKTVALTKTLLTENPILINKVITVGTKKIGYLMYNGFYADFDTQLNNAFGELKSQGVTDFVLDLRYNSGGSVRTATYLASMITGQFTGRVFAKQQWNSKINAYFEANNPNGLRNFFTDKIGTTPINSLNMTKVYILTTKSTASASELVINGLKPHIDVVQIGDITTGKNVGSVTLYDSPDFTATNRNPKHKYAMQPIVLKIVNSADFGDYFNGLTPTHELKETISTFGVLGDVNEPLLKLAIGKITGTAKAVQQSAGKQFDYFRDSKSITGFRNQMYLEKAPEGLQKALD
ncbi:MULTISPECIES: S41 family peptidase [Flavobacterium]|uniref:S41 family peptidase n=1 Tax=Flavobacterium keumense TaxID=1306518 RepID=A0ABY8N626_9FLAO|nr:MULTISPECIES: S41 family peptidase [Flavobacterium]WGK93747.1 S41 family peptidase [Flavobacterium keumense]